MSVCAVCRTDIHIIEGDLALHKMPVIPGHQIVGRVDETGGDVMRLRVGQRIGPGLGYRARCGRPAKSHWGALLRACESTQKRPVGLLALVCQSYESRW